MEFLLVSFIFYMTTYAGLVEYEILSSFVCICINMCMILLE